MPLKGKPVYVPEGFLFATTRAGIKYPDREDMGLIFCPQKALATGVFTKNLVKAAPVLDGVKKLRRPRKIAAVLVNSGCANACTGEKGMADMKRITTSLGRLLQVPETSIIMSSTGVIGQRLPVDRMLRALKELVGSIGSASPEEFARAIMTTDSFPKLASQEVFLSTKRGSVLGIAKGAGMISPNMATMLAYILTDITIEPSVMKKVLRDAVDETFNSITVDNDMSTNDTVLLLSSSGAGNSPLSESSQGFRRFQKVLYEVMDSLAGMIVRDGEGATRTMKVIVNGARTIQEAKKAARAVAGSLLVKTALYGADPNWGRIMAALGASGIRFKQERVTINLNGVKVVNSGVGTGREDEAKKEIENSKEVLIEIKLHEGSARARVLGCDLTEDYVKLNAHYTT